MKNLATCGLAALALWTASGTQAADKPVLTLDMAKQLIVAAASEARRVGAPGGAIAVVDDGGFLISAERWDNTFPSASVVSVGKARTAALFRKPTKVFEDAINKGRVAMTTLPDINAPTDQRYGQVSIRPLPLSMMTRTARKNCVSGRTSSRT